MDIFETRIYAHCREVAAREGWSDDTVVVADKPAAREYFDALRARSPAEASCVNAGWLCIWGSPIVSPRPHRHWRFSEDRLFLGDAARAGGARSIQIPSTVEPVPDDPPAGAYPRIAGINIPPRFFEELWYSSGDDDRLYPSKQDGADLQGLPRHGYQHTKFACQLTQSVLQLEGGRCPEIFRGYSTWSNALVTAMVRSGDWDARQAIHLAADSCERCMNVLWHFYVPGEGYAFDSLEYGKAGTRCDLCTPPTYREVQRG